MPHRRARLPAALALLATAALAQEPAPDAAPPVRLELGTSPVAELYYELRARAAAGEEPAADDPLAAALAATRALDGRLGWILEWGPLDARLEGCEGAADLRAAFETLPEQYERRQPGPETEPDLVPLRELALALADALAAAEPRWRAEVWPARSERLAQAAEQLAPVLQGPRGDALYRDLCRGQLMRFEAERVPVLLVTRMPRPGAATFRRADGGGISFVGLEDLDGSLLVEVVVHESIHALDAASQGQPTVLAELRRALVEAGLERRDRRGADAVHALLFLHAAELVRRHVDPAHVDYGERAGVYERLAAPVARERELFVAWLDGALELPALVAGLTSAVTAE